MTKTMGKFKKLIPAICMLLISAVLMGTSTFAWFSMNTKVTVSSMTVKATASKNLLISSTQDGTYLARLVLTTKNEKLVPVSTGVKPIPAFFKQDYVGSQMQADSYDRKNSTFQAATTNDYVKETMWIKTTGADAKNLKANVTFTGGAEALDPSLRVMFVVGGTSGQAYLMEPVTGADADYKAIDSISYAQATGTAVDGTYYYKDSNGTKLDNQPAVGDDVSSYYTQTVTETGANVTVSANNAIILTSLTADQAVQIDVYVWYEGQDENCKSTNAVTLDDTVFSIEYTVE